MEIVQKNDISTGYRCFLRYFLLRWLRQAQPPELLFPAVIQVHSFLDALVGKAQQDFIALFYGGAQGGLLLFGEAAQHKINLHPFWEVVADADAQTRKPVRAQCCDDVVHPVVGAAAPLGAQP